LQVGLTSSTTYAGVGDTWTFSLAAGLSSVLGKFIDSAPDTVSTVANIAIPGSSEFTALFDLFRFRNVRIRIVPLYQSAAQNGGDVGCASMWYSLSEKNAGAVSTLSEILQREDVQYALLTSDQRIEFDYKPLPLIDANSAGTATAGVTLPGDAWLSTAALDTATHSGVRVFFDTGRTTEAGIMQVCAMFLSYDLEFKCVI